MHWHWRLCMYRISMYGWKSRECSRKFCRKIGKYAGKFEIWILNVSVKYDVLPFSFQLSITLVTLLSAILFSIERSYTCVKCCKSIVNFSANESIVSVAPPGLLCGRSYSTAPPLYRTSSKQILMSESNLSSYWEWVDRNELITS